MGANPAPTQRPQSPTTPITGLTPREIVAAILGKARLAPDVFADGWPDSLLAIANLSEHDIGHALGLRPGPARRLAAALELHRRLTEWKVPVRPHIGSPADAMAVLAPMCGHDHERFWVLPLNHRLCLMSSPIEVSRGDVASVDAGPRMVFRPALKMGATSVIVAHNHPTGDVSPSVPDLAVTRRLVAAGRAIDIQLNDHLVIAADRSFCSIRIQHPEFFR